jgi:putative ABC transport system permease protein
MHFMPIVSTLTRHKTAAVLIILEIALTCAIVCNAVFLIRDRLHRMDAETGIAEDEIVRVQLTGIGTTANAEALTAQDLDALRAISGVKTVTNINMVPLGKSSWNTSVSTIPDDPNSPVNAAVYMGGGDLVETLGIQLISGRDLQPDEYFNFDDVRTKKAKIGALLISRGIADKLWPGENAVGKPIYAWGKEPSTVVGVFEHLARPNQVNGSQYVREAMILPLRIPYTMGGNYLLRVDASRKAEVLAQADKALVKVDPNRIILERQTFAEIRANYFKEDRAMAFLLSGVSIALLIITALGVVGLASFWVQQRTRQIGIRRALGATRGDILRYFQTENFILATAGIVIGMGLAYAINLWLMDKYQVPSLPAAFLPIGALVLWMLGQIAVLGPALRASMIPPAIATRTV